MPLWQMAASMSQAQNGTDLIAAGSASGQGTQYHFRQTMSDILIVWKPMVINQVIDEFKKVEQHPGRLLLSPAYLSLHKCHFWPVIGGSWLV